MRLLAPPLALALALGCGGAARGEIALSAHDGKQVRAGDAIPGPFPDMVATIAFGRGPTRLLGEVPAPATLNGPPVSVAVARNGRWALVANAQRFGPDAKLVPAGTVSLIDLSDPRRPRVVQAIETCAGAMGVSLTPDERLALVACASADAIAVLRVQPGRALVQLATVALDKGAEPRDVVVGRGGRAAYAVRFGDGRISELAIVGESVMRGRDIAAGTNPDGAIVSRDGRFLYSGAFGGTPLSGREGAVAIVDLRAGRLVGAVTVGQTPEHVVLSPDGRYLAVVVGNGSAFTRTAANFATVTGRLLVFRAEGATLTKRAEAPIGHNCQGATFSDDGRTLLVQCAVEKTISTFRFDGRTLASDLGGTLTFDARPGAIATARSR